MEVGEEGDYIPITITTRMIPAKMGSNESVSVGSEQVARQCPQTTTFLKKKDSAVWA